MLTPIKKQGDEHIYILLKIGIIDWMSGCYMGIYRFVRMLIGSEINRDFSLSPIFETVVSCDKNKNTATDVLRCFWWEQRESNPRPSACKADALNQLSYAPKLICIPTWSLFPNRECKYMTIFPFDKNNLTFLPTELRIYCATPQRTLISCAYFAFSRRNLRTSFHL